MVSLLFSFQVLICNLINKFGDPVHKVASRVVYGLEKVAQRHPKMKEALLDEVEKMLFRYGERWLMPSLISDTSND